MKIITKNDEIEFILKNILDALPYLMKKGVCGISCGEPSWGILDSTAKEKGFTDLEIDRIVNDLNELLSKQNDQPALY
ncbi:MAG: DUF1858 domain-containing protein [Ignavibacteriaceae bacterium]|nr:DUF1858 domain-containing protein [Ignavibacteriaceae bacterium]